MVIFHENGTKIVQWHVSNIFNTKGPFDYAFLSIYVIKSMCWECFKSISSALFTQIIISPKKKLYTQIYSIIHLLFAYIVGS